MKNIIPIIIVSLFLFGCKAEEDEATSSTTELEGSWKTACYTNSDNTSYYETHPYLNVRYRYHKNNTIFDASYNRIKRFYTIFYTI